LQDFNKQKGPYKKALTVCAALLRIDQKEQPCVRCALGNQIFHFKRIQEGANSMRSFAAHRPKRAALQTLQLILESDKN